MPADEMKGHDARWLRTLAGHLASGDPVTQGQSHANRLERIADILDTRPSTPPDVVEAAGMFADRVDELADKVRPPSAAACELHMAVIQFRAAIAALSASGGQSGMVEALECARLDLNHLAEKYGEQEFVAPTICKLNAVLPSPPLSQEGDDNK